MPDIRGAFHAEPGHKPLVPSGLTAAFETISSLEEDGLSAVLPQPERKADHAVILRLYQAMKAKLALHIRYTSMTSGMDDGQWIAPVRFSSDGESIHLRAFSFKHEEFRDYLPIRIGEDSSFETRTLSEPLPFDKAWYTRARIWLKPKAGLSPEQAAVVRREYRFNGEFLCVETRKALEFYFDRRWGLDQKGARLEKARTDYEELQTEQNTTMNKRN